MPKSQRPSADKTRNLLLKAASRLFAKQGFAGTSIRDIAAASKVNQNLIYHHYKNKKTLWQTVRHEILIKFDQLYDLSTITKKCDPKRFFQTLAYNLFNFLSNNPEELRIINWHRLEASGHAIQLERSIHSLHWQSLIANFQKQGLLRRDFPAEFALFAIITAVQNSLDTSSMFAGKNSLAKRKQYLNFAIDNLYCALKKPQ